MLKVTNLEAGYGNIKILRKVSFEVNKGDIVSILGTNGAGKTTVMRAISGIIPIWGGTIEFNGVELNNANSEQIVRSGLIQVPEDRQLFGEMTVLENLELGAFSKKARKNINKNIDYCYELFPILYKKKSQLAGTMSGGQQQMLAIARALMSEPELLILDEPSIGLSPLLTKQVFDIIKEVNKNDVTVLLVEQNVNQALSLSNQGFVIENGTVVMNGKAKELMENKQLKASYLGI